MVDDPATSTMPKVQVTFPIVRNAKANGGEDALGRPLTAAQLCQIANTQRDQLETQVEIARRLAECEDDDRAINRNLIWTATAGWCAFLSAIAAHLWLAR